MEIKKHQSSKKTSCSICSEGKLSQVIELPKFPNTGIFVKNPEKTKQQRIDQGLMLCESCGHVQLLYEVDQTFLYGVDYSNRSSQCHGTSGAKAFFVDFLEKITGKHKFKRIIEIGCNDLYLLKTLKNNAEALVGIDPIWRESAFEKLENITVVGKFIEEINSSDELEGKPDLIISSHNLEHINSPVSVLVKMMELAEDNAVFIIEVPSFDHLVLNARFDQVFHQHIQYFSLNSFSNLIEKIDAEYIDHTYNHSDWGGTLIVAFRKNKKGRADNNSPKGISRLTQEQITNQFLSFKKQMKMLQEVISHTSKPIYGYGAGQMVPTLAYHLNSDLSFLNCIFDDNSERAGLGYPGLAPKIRKPAITEPLEDASILITSIDAVRPIMKNLIKRNSRNIIVPLSHF